MGIWKNVASQVGGLAKHVTKAVVQEPVEIIENAVGQGNPSASSGQAGSNENQGMEALEQGGQAQQQAPAQDDANSPNGEAGNPKGFKTAADFQKYQQLSNNKDQMELAMLRRRLFADNGLNTDLESGMQKARMEFAQKEEERNKVEEQKKQQEEWVIEKQKDQDMSVAVAQEAANGEKKAWGAG